MKHRLTDFGKRVRKRQIDLDITQVELAKMVEEKTKLRVEPTYLQKILNGQRSSQKIVDALIDILDIEN